MLSPGRASTSSRTAPFLGAVQIIVYTGAIMILFLFVLMLVGRDASDSLVETLRGQRVAAIVLGIGFAGLVGAGIARAHARTCRSTGLDGGATADRQRPAIAELLFTRYVFAFEVTSALLITAAVGAMVLAHNEREPGSRPTQRELSRARFHRRPPQPAARPRRLRPRQLGRHARPCCPTAAPRQLRHRRRAAGLDELPGRPAGAARLPDAALGTLDPAPDGGTTDEPRPTTWCSPRCCSPSAPSACWSGATRSCVFMCVELMLNAVNLTLVTFARIHGTLDGQIMAFFVMVVAAAEVVVGLAIIMSIFRTRRSASVDDANLLKY